MMTPCRQENTEDIITLGDGSVRVDTGLGFFERVSGSRIVSHEPAGVWTQAQEDGLYRRAWQPQPQVLPPHSKWCYRCGCIRDKGMFRSDTTRLDGLYVICKACEHPLDAQRKRRKYHEEVAAEGREVRQYTRQTD